MVKVWAWQLCGLHKRGIEASWTLPQNISNEQIPDTDNNWCRCGSGVFSDVLLLHDALDRFAVLGLGVGWQQADLNLNKHADQARKMSQLLLILW